MTEIRILSPSNKEWILKSGCVSRNLFQCLTSCLGEIADNTVKCFCFISRDCCHSLEGGSISPRNLRLCDLSSSKEVEAEVTFTSRP